MIQSQKEALEKFLTSSSKAEIKNLSKEIVEQTNLNELRDNEVMVKQTIENDNDERPCDNVIIYFLFFIFLYSELSFHFKNFMFS